MKDTQPEIPDFIGTMHVGTPSFCWLDLNQFGSGCGSAGRAVTSYNRDPWFQLHHQQNFIYQLYNRKDKNSKKRPGMAQL